MGRTMTKNPSWIQFDNDVWGEAVGSSSDHDDWLRSLDSHELPASTLDPLPDVKAPLRQGWIAEQAKESVEEYRSRVVGPYGPTWAYRSGIEAEISRLSLACRESTGTEAEANLRLLRGAEAALREFDNSPEFHEAIRHALGAVERDIEAAGSNLTPSQVAAKGRYAAIRASLEAMIARSANKPESREDQHAEETSSVTAMTPMKKAMIVERLTRRYPSLENDFKRGEPWAKDCTVPGRRGYYFLELVEKACVSKWGGSSGGESAPQDCFSTTAQLSRANRR